MIPNLQIIDENGMLLEGNSMQMIQDTLNELIDGYNKLHEGYKLIHEKLDPLMTIIHENGTVDWRFLGDFEALRTHDMQKPNKENHG